MEKELQSLIRRIREYDAGANEDQIKKAYDFAKKKYKGQKRLSGDSFIVHATETAKILTTQKVDESTIIAALLHELKPDVVSGKFGKDVDKLVSAYYKMSSIKSSKNNELESLRKMSLVMAKDLRVVLIKLADRLHNLQSLDSLPADKRKEIAKETMDIYVPIASRLGIYRIRSILEDMCFKHLKEKEYKAIQEELKTLGKKKKNVIETITNVVKEFLDKNGYEANVSGRLKNAFSIYKKLKKKGKTSIDEIHDIFAIRVILPSEFDENGEEKVTKLYELIGNIHNKWKPVPGRFKDYIGFPKPNGYKSLHTTVVGIAPHSFKEPVEIQIRSSNMHEEAEFGVASHWLYKESKGKNNLIKAQVEWIKNLAKLTQENEVINEIKVDIFQDRIFVFTPGGDVKDLPADSTPIDFAYSVHTDVGNKCIMAKVNSKIVPLDHKLNNGDVVEILTRSNGKPKLEWLGFVQTAGAKAKIKSYFNQFESDEYFKKGKELVNKKLEEINKPILDPKLKILKNYGGQTLNFKKREELIKLVGSGTLLASQLIWKVYEYNKVSPKKKRPIKGRSKKAAAPVELENRIIVGNARGLPVRLAKCCKPKYGHSIKAFITRGNSLSIHKHDCKILDKSDSIRHLSAGWY